MTTSRPDYRAIELPEQAPRPRIRLARTIVFGLALLLLALVALGLWRGERLGFLGQRLAHASDWAPGTASARDLPEGFELLTQEVTPIDLEITALENGTLESASSVNVLSAVEGQVAIIRLIPEGTRVAVGDVVIELESSGLRTRKTEQEIVVERARNTRAQSLQDGLVAESQGESNVQSAKLALEFARLDLQKYIEGQYPLDQRELETATALAEEELERARVQQRFSEDLERDGYLQAGELEADRFRVVRAQFAVDIAKEKERLLKEFTFPRAKRDLESKVQEAERSLARAENLALASVEQAKTNLGAAEKTLELEQDKLAHIQQQIEKCTMRAPQAGVVVYPVPTDNDLADLFIKQGTVIREQQHVFSIPDTDVMRVSTLIHEALVNRIRPGLQARVWVDVFPDLELRGEVEHVSPLPDPEDWRKETVKFYEIKVRLLDQGGDLRPGMSTKVEILIGRLEEVLAAPVQAVVRRGKRGLCYVEVAGAPVLRQLELGESNTQYVAVLAGLTAGERVILSPDVLGFPPDLLQQESSFEWQPEAPPDPAVPAAGPPIVETEYDVILLGAGGATAEVEYEIQATPEGEELKRKFEVTMIQGTPGATLEVSVGGVVLGSLTLDAAGSGVGEWNTKKGTFPEQFPRDAGQDTLVKVGDMEGPLARN